MSLVIEFCGLPGAGKTTLCRALEIELRRRGVHVEDHSLPAGDSGRLPRLRTKTATFIGAMVSSPVGVGRLFLSGWATGLRGRELIVRCANLVVAGRRLRHPTVDVALVDQAGIQEVLSVAVTTDPTLILAAFVPGMFDRTSTIVVSVAASVPDAARRLTDRGTRESRFETMAPKRRTRELARASATLADVIASLESHDVRVWSVDGRQADAANQLAERICRSAGL